jgi:hypothetical protein
MLSEHSEHVFNTVQNISTFVEGLLSDLRSFADPLELNLGSRFSALNWPENTIFDSEIKNAYY